MILELQLEQYGANGAFNPVITSISNALTTLGLQKTNDAGQINVSTASFSQNQSNVSSGYEIRTFTDALSATAPVYLKIEYGDGDNFAIAFWVTVGTGSDGNGNLTGQVSTRTELYSNYPSQSPQNCYFSGAPNRLAFSMFDGPITNYPQIFGIERTKDANGNDTATGVIIYIANGTFNGGSQSTVLPTTGTWQGFMPCWSAAINYYGYTNSANSMQNDSTTGVAIPIPFNFYPYNPGLNFLIYQGTDFGSYTQTSLPMYGTNHNYLAINTNVNPTIATTPNNNQGGACNNTHILMRYE